jgi:hypothetical protein
MKKATIALLLIGIALAPIWADGQFRLAGNTATQVDTLTSESLTEWQSLVIPNEGTMTGWSWEVIFDHLGLGMHYGIRFNEPVIESDAASDWYLDWKGDFFLSYHVMGGGSVVDPFVEFGWGNVGTALVSSSERYDYPDWEDEVEDGNAVALGFYNYFAGGVAVDLNGLLLGVKVSYIPSEIAGPVTEPTIERYALSQFEVSLFGGVALGGHRNRRNRSHWD